MQASSDRIPILVYVLSFHISTWVSECFKWYIKKVYMHLFWFPKRWLCYCGCQANECARCSPLSVFISYQSNKIRDAQYGGSKLLLLLLFLFGTSFRANIYVFFSSFNILLNCALFILSPSTEQHLFQSHNQIAFSFNAGFHHHHRWKLCSFACLLSYLAACLPACLCNVRSYYGHHFGWKIY